MNCPNCGSTTLVHDTCDLRPILESRSTQFAGQALAEAWALGGLGIEPVLDLAPDARAVDLG